MAFAKPSRISLPILQLASRVHVSNATLCVAEWRASMAARLIMNYGPSQVWQLLPAADAGASLRHSDLSHWFLTTQLLFALDPHIMHLNASCTFNTVRLLAIINFAGICCLVMAFP